MKSIEELIDEYRQALNKYIYVCDHDRPFIVDFGKEVDLVEAEILRRFDELEDKYENDTGDLIAKIADRDSKIAELEKEVENLQKEYREMGVERDNALVAYENMKCCGTCLHYNHRKEYCPHKDDRDNQSYYKCWIPDGLKRSER